MAGNFLVAFAFVVAVAVSSSFDFSTIATHQMKVSIRYLFLPVFTY